MAFFYYKTWQSKGMTALRDTRHLEWDGLVPSVTGGGPSRPAQRSSPVSGSRVRSSSVCPRQDSMATLRLTRADSVPASSAEIKKPSATATATVQQNATALTTLFNKFQKASGAAGYTDQQINDKTASNGRLSRMETQLQDIINRPLTGNGQSHVITRRVEFHAHSCTAASPQDIGFFSELSNQPQHINALVQRIHQLEKELRDQKVSGIHSVRTEKVKGGYSIVCGISSDRMQVYVVPSEQAKPEVATLKGKLAAVQAQSEAEMARTSNHRTRRNSLGDLVTRALPASQPTLNGGPTADTITNGLQSLSNMWSRMQTQAPPPPKVDSSNNKPKNGDNKPLVPSNYIKQPTYVGSGGVPGWVPTTPGKGSSDTTTSWFNSVMSIFK